MKLIADSRGRLTAAELFHPGNAFEAHRMPDGSIRVVKLEEQEVPTVKIKINQDGSFTCPRLLSREGIRAADRKSVV